MSPIELFGATLGLLNQWLTIAQRIWCWPVGIASVFVYLFVFYDAKLYSDMLLQGIYIVLQVYGWVNWSKARSSASGAQSGVQSVVQLGVHLGPQSLVPVTRLQPRGWAIVSVTFLAFASALGTLMGRYTDAALPYWDAAPTVLSLIAQYLQARKVLESWLLFIAANLVFIGVYVVKGLYPTVVLFVVITILAGYGYTKWRRAYQPQGLK